MLRKLRTVVFGMVVLFGVVLGALSAEAKEACSCACVDPDLQETFYEWTNLTSGDRTCRSDCSEACGGPAFLVEEESLLVTVDCLPGRAADCTSSSAYSAYRGVNCVEIPAGIPREQWTGSNAYLSRTNGRRPTCTIPPTAENANIECRQFGGPAAGGTCGVLVEGEDPRAYNLSRPTLGGRYGIDVFDQTDYDAYLRAIRAGNVNPQTEAVLPPEATDGMCFRYGVLYGGAPTYDGFDPRNADIAYVPSADYVCFSRKRNTCGTSAQPSLPGVTALPQSFSCRQPSSVQEGERCFSANQSESLCVASPGTLCCQGGTALSACYSDLDCDFPRELCAEGRCVRTSICDRENQDRECRTASPAEKQNPEICSIEYPGGEYARCTGEQACCTAFDREAYSGCAADKLTDITIDDAVKEAYKGFDCVDSANLPLSQFMSAQDFEEGINQRGSQRFIGDATAEGQVVAGGGGRTGRENEYTGGGQYHCLGSGVPRPEGGSESRCTVRGQVCCNINRLELAQQLEDRPGQGQECGPTNANYQCLDVNQVTALNQAVGVPDEAFLRGLAGRRVCQITQLSQDTFFTNAECQGGYVCCDPSAATMVLCQEDADCANDGSAVCDSQLGVCIAQEFAAAATLEGDGCFLDAVTLNGYTPDGIEERTGFEGPAFSCQFVSPETTGVAAIGSNCLPPQVACGDAPVPPGLGEGFRAQCCIPNTGVAPSVAAQAQSGGDAVEEAPFSLRISECIKDGNCGLEDILYTGAQFANFLIQISGAIFLAIFVYGGFKYLTAGTTSRAAEGKKMIIQASVAMILLLAAFTFVNFVQQALIGAVIENDAQASCGADAQTANFACQFLASDPNDSAAVNEEVSRRGCVRNRCPGPENYLCCPL